MTPNWMAESRKNINNHFHQNISQEEALVRNLRQEIVLFLNTSICFIPLYIGSGGEKMMATVWMNALFFCLFKLYLVCLWMDALFVLSKFCLLCSLCHCVLGNVFTLFLELFSVIMAEACLLEKNDNYLVSHWSLCLRLLIINHQDHWLSLLSGDRNL